MKEIGRNPEIRLTEDEWSALEQAGGVPLEDWSTPSH